MTATVTPIESHIAQIRREAAAQALTAEAELIRMAPNNNQKVREYNAKLATVMLQRAQQYQTGELTL